nr:ricin B, lectin domain, glycoside hydrolase, family 5 [Tanacetum cinerariifolium]
MIILDNHLSKPGWCCNDNDGNGFFGDLYFDPQVWINGVTRVATMFRGYTNVIGMSLRNELRGRRQDVNTWYKYMQKCAERVHAANPNVLVILSGLNYDLDLSFLQNNPVKLSFNNKLVFEAHWYGFSNGNDWATSNSNEVCGRVIETMQTNAIFLLDQGYPLFISEWGVDQRGTNENDNRYLNCFLGWAAEHDLDWALWSLVGSYYYREGVAGMEEFYGVLNWNWHEARNSSFLKKISPLQSPFQGKGTPWHKGGADITVIGVLSQEGLEGNVAGRKKMRSKEAKLENLLKYKQHYPLHPLDQSLVFATCARYNSRSNVPRSNFGFVVVIIQQVVSRAIGSTAIET